MTKRGCDLRLLHAAYTAHTLLAGRGEDAECAASESFRSRIRLIRRRRGLTAGVG